MKNAGRRSGKQAGAQASGASPAARPACDSAAHPGEADCGGLAHAEDALVRLNEALRASNAELTRFNSAMVARELRMIELKKQVNELYLRAGQPPPYEMKSEQEAEGDGDDKRH